MGKTQTILNIVVNCLTNNKTLLISSNNNIPIDGIKDKLFLGKYNNKEILFPIIRLGNNKCIAEALKIDEYLTSPSFTILNEYDANGIKLYHFDLYRLNTIEDLENIGYEEYFFGQGISIIEWAEKCEELLPQGSFLIYFKYLAQNKREIKIYKK